MRTRLNRPQSNGIVERLHRRLLDEHFRVEGRKTRFETIEEMQGVLDAFGAELKPDELRLQAFPHPISGALDFHQRLEFLRFHLQRHHQQVARILRLQREQAIGTADL